MLVKLNGVIESTKPSSGRISVEFSTPGGETSGCRSSWKPRASWQLNLQQSLSSTAETLSA